MSPAEIIPQLVARLTGFHVDGTPRIWPTDVPPVEHPRAVAELLEALLEEAARRGAEQARMREERSPRSVARTLLYRAGFALQHLADRLQQPAPR